MTPFDFDTLDLEEAGPFTVLLDDLATNGVPEDMRRRFAAWLESTVGKLLDERNEWRDMYKDLRDQHPEQVMPDAKTFYHPDKAAADAVLQELLLDPRVATGAVQLEPHNGWMVVLVPKLADLSNLAGHAEIQDGRRNPVPIGKAKAKPLATLSDSASKRASPAGDGAGKAQPTKGATAQVWAIADTYANEKGRVDRAAIIGLCTAAGINPATAGTQYSKWKRERGHQ